MLSYFILKITLLGRYCYESHLSEEAVELRGLKRLVSKNKKKRLVSRHWLWES